MAAVPQHPARLHASRSASRLSRRATGTCGSGRRPSWPYDPSRCLYHFRWFWDYSGGQTTNLLAHHIDIVQWMMGNGAAAGRRPWARRYSLKGIGETPDVFEAHLRVPRLPRHLVEPRARGGGRGRPGVLRHEGNADARAAPASRSCPSGEISPRTRSRASAGRGRSPADAGAAHDAAQGERLRAGARPVRAARARLPRLRQVAPGADLRPREQPPRRAVPATSPTSRCELGRTLRWDDAKQDVVGDAGSVRAAHQGVPQPLGPRAQGGARPWLRRVATSCASLGGAAALGAVAGRAVARRSPARPARTTASPTRRSPSVSSAAAT